MSFLANLLESAAHRVRHAQTQWRIRNERVNRTPLTITLAKGNTYALIETGTMPACRLFVLDIAGRPYQWASPYTASFMALDDPAHQTATVGAVAIWHPNLDVVRRDVRFLPSPPEALGEVEP